MPFNYIAALTIGGSGFPAVRDPPFEQFVGCRMLVPDGDRRHGSQSRGVVNEEDIAIGNDHIVREFILRDHLGNDLGMDICFRLSCSPRENLAQPFTTGDLAMLILTQHN